MKRSCCCCCSSQNYETQRHITRRLDDGTAVDPTSVLEEFSPSYIDEEYESTIDDHMTRSVIDTSPPPTNGFTPPPADCINAATLLSQAVESVTSQDPDGIGWITPAQWSAAVWDGIPIDPCTHTTAELCAFVFPNPNTMRGLRERFYEVNPFADNTAPTSAEIDAWNVEIVRHLRALFGITTPVTPDRCLYVRAQWSHERKFTTIWDTLYPVGICGPGSTEHCGANFVPDCSDQIPYLSGGACCASLVGTEGLMNVDTDIPWSIKLTRVIASWLCSEGISAHLGPFLGREKVGMSFHCFGGVMSFRGKWGGTLTPPCS